MTVTRESLIHCAGVYLRESRARTKLQRRFSFTLLGWAARCRREAAAMGRTGSRQTSLSLTNNRARETTAQGELF